MLKLIFITLFVIGASSASWIFLSKNQDTPHESNNDVTAELLTFNTITSPINTDGTSHINTSVIDDIYCDASCQESIELLRFQAEFNDDEYEVLLNSSPELAIYLKENPKVRAEFIELATTSTPNNRNIIMAAFNELDLLSRSQLGQALIAASDWHSRFDGIRFLSKSDLMDEPLAQQLSEILADEPAYYVRSSIVKALNQPGKFHGNQEIINTLKELAYSDDNNAVKGEALLARIQLEHDPETVFTDAFLAIRSDQEEYQIYGLRALNQIITQKSLNESEVSWEYKEEAKYLFEELKGTKYDTMPIDFLNMIDSLFDRLYINNQPTP